MIKLVLALQGNKAILHDSNARPSRREQDRTRKLITTTMDLNLT